MKVRKLVSAILCLALAVSLAACSQGASTADTKKEQAASKTSKVEEKNDEIVIALMMKSLASEWNQNIEASLEKLGEEKGFKVLTFDADGDSAKQLDQLNDAINQGVDAIFMHIADEGIAQAAAETVEAAGIPMIGESLPLKDGEGNWLIPCVVLDAAGCGVVASDWIAENWKSTSVDLADTSKVGVIMVTNTLTENAVLRHEGAVKELKVKMPDIPEENYYIADISASSDDYIDGGYTETGAVLAAHPDMTSWIVVGVQDDYALGACRAIEEAGATDKTILVSLGGEQAIPEWKGGTTTPWYATVYYTAMDFTEPVVDGLLSVVNKEAALEEVYADNIAEGQTYGTKTIKGKAITYQNYEEYVK